MLRTVLAVFVVLLAAVAGCSAGGSTLRVGVIASGSEQGYGIESWALQRGILARHLGAVGITDIAFTTFPNGPNLNQALKGGSLDIGVLGDTPAISGRSAELPTQLVGVTVRGQDSWLIAGNGVGTVADLAGRTVATQQGSYMHRYLVGLLDSAGLGGSVKITFLLVNSAQQALDKGDIAAYAAPVPTAPLLASKGYRVLDKASAHPGLSGNSYTTISASAASRHPKLAGAWNAALAEAASALKANPAEYHGFAARTSGLPQPVIEAAYPATLYGSPSVTGSDLATLRGTLDFLLAQHLAAAPFDVNAWVAPGVGAP